MEWNRGGVGEGDRNCDPRGIQGSGVRYEGGSELVVVAVDYATYSNPHREYN